MLLASALLVTAQPPEVDVAVPADDADPTELTGSLEAAFSQATGNTENLNLGLTGELNYEVGSLTHNLNAAINYAEDGGTGGGDREVTQQNFFAAYELDVGLSERGFAFGRVRYEQDEFSGFARRVFVGLGYGYRFYQSDVLNWKVTGGPGLRWVETDDSPPEAIPFEPGTTRTDFSLYANSEFEWDIRENVGFEHDFNVIYTSPNTTFETQIALKTRLTELLSARLSYFVRHETEPPLEREPTDTLLRAGIVVDF